MTRIKSGLLNAVFLLAPVWFYAGAKSPDIFAGQLLFLEAATLLILGLLHFNRWIGAFLMLTGAHWFIFDCPMYETKVIYIACGAAIYHFVASYYRGKGYRWVIVGILAWTIALSILQYFKMDILFWQNLEPSGTWTLPSYMGIFAAVTAAPMLAFSFAAAMILNAAVLSFSKSSFAAVAFWVSLTPFVKKKWLILSLIATIPLGFLILKDKSSGDWQRRLNIWPMALSTAFRSPFFGAGAGNYGQWMFLEFKGKEYHYFQVKMKPENEQPTKDMILKIAQAEGTDTSRIENIHFKEPYAPFRNMKEIMDDLRGKEKNALHGYIWNHCHNEYLQLFFEYGLAGLWLLFMYCLDIFKRYKQLIDRPFLEPLLGPETKGLFGSFLAVLVISAAHFPFHVPRLAVPIIFLLALLDSRLPKEVNSEREE